MTSLPKTTLILLAAIFAIYGEAVCQIGGQNPLGPFADSIERRRAEQDLRSLPQKVRNRIDRNLSNPRIVKQMNEDFLRIQAIRVELVKDLGSGSYIEPRKLEASASEIKKRASRLREMLVLTEEESDIQIAVDPTPSLKSVNARAFELCLEISRFTGNPLFKAKGVITISHAREASLSLDTVIALAGAVEKEADKLADN